MKLKSIKEVKNLKNKRVFLRSDFNVSLSGDGVSESEATKIREGLPTIEYLIRNGAIIIIATHLGRPDGKIVDKYRLDPVARKLSELLKKPVKKMNDIVSDQVKKTIENAESGDVIMLENIRFSPDEEKNSDDFAKKLAQLAEIYVNDAFAGSHRAHTSLEAITNFLPSYAGLLLEKEVNALSRFINNPKHPIVSIIGGAKISTKLGLVKSFLKDTDALLLGGALANTVLKAKGISVGRSLIESDMIEEIKKINLTDIKLHIPVDVLVSKTTEAGGVVETKAVGNVLDDEYILDIGPDTVNLFNSVIKKARSIIWNGPMGMFEIPQYRMGTQGIVEEILKSKANVAIGGGDTIKLLEELEIKSLSSHPNIYVSTGGGAMLEFFEYKTLPAIKPLVKQ